MKKLPLLFVLCLLALWGSPLGACTLFVLTDGERTLFCNNEDFSNPKTRIWFLPGVSGRLGCALVGYDDGLPQGGVNTAGLALDWVAGASEKWIPDAIVPDASGYSSLRVLETCSTLEEAIAYFRSQRDDPGFSYAAVLVADKTGASAIVGAHNGEITVLKANQCRGFGYGQRTLDKRLALKPAVTEKNATEILAACRQRGRFATKYSTVYDLKTGDILLAPLANPADTVKFNLATELLRGGHFYEMPKVQSQLATGGLLLPTLLERRLVGDRTPISDANPDLTSRLGSFVRELSHGALPDHGLDASFSKGLKKDLKKTQAIIRTWGDFIDLKLVDQGREDTKHLYRYQAQFQQATALLRFTLEPDAKISGVSLEDIARFKSPGP